MCRSLIEEISWLNVRDGADSPFPAREYCICISSFALGEPYITVEHKGLRLSFLIETGKEIERRIDNKQGDSPYCLKIRRGGADNLSIEEFIRVRNRAEQPLEDNMLLSNKADYIAANIGRWLNTPNAFDPRLTNRQIALITWQQSHFE